MDYSKNYFQATFLVDRIRKAAAEGNKTKLYSGLGARMQENEKKLEDFDTIKAQYMQSIQDMFEPLRQETSKEVAVDAVDAVGQSKRFPGMGDYAAYESEAADRIQSKLVARGMPEHIAKGFVMNFMDESGLSSTVNEKNPLVKGSRGGFGLYQLTADRRKAYEAYAERQGIDTSDPMEQEDAQLSFLMEELSGPEKNAWQTIQTAPDAGTAAAYIVRDFLRPAEEHQMSRASKYTGRSLDYITRPKKKF